MLHAYAVLRTGSSLKIRLALPGFIAVVVCVCVVRCYAGLFGILAYPHDVFALIDPAWRILHGQRPHIDFYSQLGPVPYLQTALGLMVARDGAEGLVYGQVLGGLVVTIWMYIVARKSMFQPLCFLLTFYILLLCLSPFNIGESYSVISAAMTYNRLAYGLTAIILVEAIAVRIDGGFSGIPGGFSTGAALALLLFTKITFFAGAAFLVCAFAFLFPQTKARWAGVGAGFSLVLLALLSYLKFNLTAVVQDYLISAGAKHIGPAKLLGSALEIGSNEGVSLLIFISLVVLVLRPQIEPAIATRFGISGLVVLVVSSFLLFGNFQGRGLPLNACFAIVMADVVNRNSSMVRAEFYNLRFVLALWAFLLAAGPILSGLAGICYAASERAGGKVPVMETPSLASFRIRDAEYASFVDDGVSLAQRNVRSGETIISLDFSDFYSYSLRIAPPLGGASCLHFGSTFNDRSHPAPERLLGGASIVMMPVKFSEVGSQESIPRIYRPYLARHFHLESSSRQWRLYRRNP